MCKLKYTHGKKIIINKIKYTHGDRAELQRQTVLYQAGGRETPSDI